VTRRPASVVAAVVCALVLVACTGNDPVPNPTAEHESHHSTADAPPGKPLRAGEKFLDLTMPEPYTPKAPTTGTDDYRCFLLDPELADPAFVTGTNVVPGRPDLVHHVIMFRIGPEAVAQAKAADTDDKGQGWTCFGGAAIGSDYQRGLERAPWLGAWAPGSGESILDPDLGVPLEAGSRIIMQVHYNLRAGDAPDTSSARLRLAPGTADLKALETMLLPGPVELPCRPGKSGRLCDRDAAVRDVTERFGGQSGFMVVGLQLMCGGDPNHAKAAAVQTCDRRIGEPATVRAAAGHMHLLGRSISITLNPGKRTERKLLDIPVWNFDDQRAIPLAKPVKIDQGDVLRVRCRHDQALRDVVPDLAGTPERYVVWGDGTTDEMCLGIVMVTGLDGRK
jgi:Copper type II ascorbate-dependent monooxygenase, C-terminal domain